MKTSDFYYNLPEELIAQTPLLDRSSSRLLVCDINTDEVYHKHFYDIIDYLNEGDVLVLNETRVIPARLYAKKETGANIEVFLLKRIDINKWECLIKPAKRLKINDNIIFSEDLSAKLVGIIDDGIRIIEFEYEGVFEEIIEKIGTTPLPPYIHNKLNDKERYQTVYNRNKGSSAAPTAGLHFTNELLEKIYNKNIQIAKLTLHVGLGTFRPVKVEDINSHKMHSEEYYIDAENAQIIENARLENRRIIAVGTTSTRALESIYNKYNKIVESHGSTDIFIYPGVKLNVIKGLITNFHLPESTLLMLVSAFYDRDKILNLYNEAVKEKYRFFSFGDAMFLKS